MPGPRRGWGWAVWGLAPLPLAWLVLVEVVAVALIVLSSIDLFRSWISGTLVDELMIAPGISGVLVAVVLTAFGIANVELDAMRLRPERVQFHGPTSFDFLSVWMFAAAVLLPPALSVLSIAFVYFHHWWRLAERRALFKTTYNLATLVLAAHAAYAIVGAWGSGSPIALLPAAQLLPAGTPAVVTAVVAHTPVALPAIVAFAVVNQGLVIIMMSLAMPRAPITVLLGPAEENVTEAATLAVGAVIAALTLHHPALLVLLLGPLALTQRLSVARRLQRTATTDSKTGLLTHAAWHERAALLLLDSPHGEWKQRFRLALLRRTRRLVRGWSAESSADRPGAPIGLLGLDIDHFKRINDAHGHPAGDAVLHQVAQRLRSVVGDRDLVARFGGEEFGVLLCAPRSPRPPLDPPRAVADTAERLRAAVAGTPIVVRTPDGPLTIGPVTISIGAVALPPDCTAGELDVVVSAADRALYLAKHHGRDRVVVNVHRRRQPMAQHADTERRDTRPRSPLVTDHVPTEPLGLVRPP